MAWLGEGAGWAIKVAPPAPGGALPWTAPVPDITNFTPAGETLWTGINGWQVANHTPEKAWSLTNPDSQTVRFETRGGDQWYWDIQQNTGSSHNSCQFVRETPVGNDFFVQYELMIEPGPPITSWFFVIDQIQAPPGGTPPFYIGIENQQMMVRLALDSTQSNYVWPFRDTVDVIRGHWYQMQVLVNFGANKCDIWRDGIQIVNYRGAFGNDQGGNGTYQIGIYRNDVPETVALNYRNMVMTPG